MASLVVVGPRSPPPMKTHFSIFCAFLVLCLSAFGQSRGVEERLSDVEKRVSALEKVSPLSLSKPLPSTPPATRGQVEESITKQPPEEQKSTQKRIQLQEEKGSLPPGVTKDFEEMNDRYDSSPDQLLFAATRLIPDRVYIHRHNLDSVAVAIFRMGGQGLTVVARHDFQGRIITQIEWSPDSKFLLFTTADSSGHSPWHAAAFLFCATDNSFRDVDAAIGNVTSPKFRFESPDIAIMEVKKGEMPEEQVKLPLAKTMHHMPRVR
jgi:hypothetical protein